MNKAIDVWHQPFTPELMKKAYADAKEQHDVIEWWGLSERVRGRTPKQFVSDMDEIGVDKVMIPASKFKSYKDQEMQWNFTIEEILIL